MCKYISTLVETVLRDWWLFPLLFNTAIIITFTFTSDSPSILLPIRCGPGMPLPNTSDASHHLGVKSVSLHGFSLSILISYHFPINHSLQTKFHSSTLWMCHALFKTLAMLWAFIFFIQGSCLYPHLPLKYLHLAVVSTRSLPLGDSVILCSHWSCTRCPSCQLRLGISHFPPMPMAAVCSDCLLPDASPLNASPFQLCDFRWLFN